MEKFLYLSESKFAKSWIDGTDSLPYPSLASSYLSNVRMTTKTPDETHIIRGHDMRAVSNFKVNGMAFLTVDRPDLPYEVEMSNNQIITNTGRVLRVPDASGSHHIEDGYVLSFSNTFKQNIGILLGKVICIKIKDIESLKASLDEQMGEVGVMKSCTYTKRHTRNHFLKGQKDAWQDEFRIFWPLQRSQTSKAPLRIEKGTASFVSHIYKYPFYRPCLCGSGKAFIFCHSQNPTQSFS